MRNIARSSSRLAVRPIPLALVLLAVVALLLSAVLPAVAEARSLPFGTVPPVNVSVSFNSQMPLADLSEETLAAAQKSAREQLYRLAGRECELLKAILAESCRLTHLNVSTQVQHHNNHQSPILLRINGTASFAIGLKGDVVEE